MLQNGIHISLPDHKPFTPYKTEIPMALVTKFLRNYFDGLKDGLNVPILFTSISEHRQIIPNLRKCFLLNFLFGASYTLVIFIFLPLLRNYLSSTIQSAKFLIFSTELIVYIFGFVPFYLLSFLFNSTFYGEISGEIRAPVANSGSSSNIGDYFAEVVMSALFGVVFLLEITLLSAIPFVGKFISFIFTCIYFSLSSFEYRWINDSRRLEQRVNAIEKCWPYFIGFGTPVTLLYISLPYLVAVAVTGLLFPLLIILAGKSKPRTYPINFMIFRYTMNLVDQTLVSTLVTFFQKQNKE